jgi:hypothetical protein
MAEIVQQEDFPLVAFDRPEEPRHQQFRKMHTLCSQLYYGMTEEDLNNVKRKDSLFARSSPFAFFS